MTILFFLLTILLFPPVTFAAYNSATVVSNELKEDGRTRLVFQITGNAGEPVVTREYLVSSSSTVAILLNWVDSTINELNLMRSAATLPALQKGQTVTPLAPTTPALTPRQVWLQKLARLRDMNAAIAAGVSNATLTTEFNTLKTDIENTYPGGAF